MFYLKNEIRHPCPHEGKLKEVAVQVEGLTSGRPAVGAPEDVRARLHPPPREGAGGRGQPDPSQVRARPQVSSTALGWRDWGSGTRGF